MKLQTDTQQEELVTASLELRALERMIQALLKQIEIWVDKAKAQGLLRSKECSRQTEAFLDRRTQAKILLGNNTISAEPLEIRISRLEQMIESLRCSQDYFRTV